ncbi:DinB family protein [Algoriphagus sp. A40]|uniref:DinB family protein n=1 Tax=Algoriphagus sp. A40 TaxID=1945863 RepID=UPI000985AF83|nr:DinB family protein [Algoriphagus sp. A40]OOG76413.1 hypothetical protein B0E43_07925 [Algoriphagus sp. A40]
MNKLFPFLFILLLFCCQEKVPEGNIRSVLEEQLINSHSKAEWFVPINNAVKGLSVEQANWKDSTENHSIAQLTSHLLFWNRRLLNSFQGNKEEEYKGKNTETFSQLDSTTWAKTVEELDLVMKTWESEVTKASDEQLKEWTTSIANISSHNAYHTGQILYIRKMKGWWDASQGVQ